MPRFAASKAESAAAALEAYLHDRPRHLAGKVVLQPQECAAAPPASCQQPAAGPFPWPAHTDWLHHRLCVTGPGSALDQFQQAAAGAGTIPWHLDLDTLEEDWFHLLANPAHRELSLPGSRMLAAQLHDPVERRHVLAVAQIGRSRACPLDLHALVPVPARILRLGPDHPDALSWLWQHWGTTEALRHVAPQQLGKDGKPVLPTEQGALRLTFWSAD